MIDALRYEWVRLRTLRSTYWLTGAGIVLSLAVAGVVGYVSRNGSIDDGMTGIILTGGIPFSPLPLVAIFMGLIGALAFGHEYRHGTILPTLAAVPRRNRLVVAKLLTIAIWSLVTAIVSVLLNWALGSALSGGSLPLTNDVVLPAMIGYVLYVMLWGVLGLGLAALLRNLPVAIVLIFVVPLMIEPLVSALTLLPALEPIRGAVHFFPFSSGTRLAQLFDASTLVPEGQASPYGEPPTRLVAGLTFTAWIVLVMAPAWVLFKRRDA